MNSQNYMQEKPEINEWDQKCFLSLTRIDLTPEQENMIINPENSYPETDSVLAVHWHPENIPLDLIKKRVSILYPSSKQELIIPTQHNELMSYGDYAGVEIDCYSPEFNRKVQLLVHFSNSNLKNADTFKSILQHTYNYRSSQFYQLLDTAADLNCQNVFLKAANNVESDEATINFVHFFSKKLKMLCDSNSDTPAFSLKNKLLVNYIQTLKTYYDEHTIHKAIILIAEIKRLVKLGFSMEYFYKTADVIAEIKSLGGTIVIPHPEQFWPILLADYDVDGIEVWNPQSLEFSEFLIEVVASKNRINSSKKKLLIFMGDDTHFSEKIKPKELQFASKVKREIGYQPFWDTLLIKHKSQVAGLSKQDVIEEYKLRLNS